jgi:hypothetical protein
MKIYIDSRFSTWIENFKLKKVFTRREGIRKKVGWVIIEPKNQEFPPIIVILIKKREREKILWISIDGSDHEIENFQYKRNSLGPNLSWELMYDREVIPKVKLQNDTWVIGT